MMIGDEMIFQHTLDEVLNGTKTQTSRIVKPGDRLVWNDDDNTTHFVVSGNGRLKWWVGNTYAVQPGYGKKAVARIRILRIRQMDVREFVIDDLIAEGLGGGIGFLKVWCQIHDPEGLELLGEYGIGSGWVFEQPEERYQAWVLNFELVKS